MKFYLWSLRDEGLLCEALAGVIAEAVAYAAEPFAVEVSVTQKSRGGISITSDAYWSRERHKPHELGEPYAPGDPYKELPENL